MLPKKETILPTSLKAIAQPSSISKSGQQPSLERMIPSQLSPERKPTSTYLENKTIPELIREEKLTTLSSAEKKDVLQVPKRKRTLPAWLVQIATSSARKLETKKPVSKKKERAVPSHHTSPKYEFSESEEDKTPKRAPRKNRQSRQKISLDDFIVSDEEWEETDNRKRKKSVRKGNDSGSDWEVENRKKKWNKEYNSSSDSGGGHKKKKTSRKVINSCASNKDIVPKKAAGNQSLGSQKSPLSPETNEELLTEKQKNRKSCRFGENCYRKNPLHFEEFSHPGDADFVFGDEAEEASSDNEDNKPEYQNNLKQKKKYNYSKKNRPKREAARKGRKRRAENRKQ
ncbi:aprataxin and PNK-like factor isoform X3 [Limulus polyphemus]|uniref:Aprataxin and PNK-like factor isoform X3 n=1 Tax=Limulus polyphemus TaxID=6850 RepID=A0ABM1SD40_LIMPO|nr:aprataxin and PNK-like factor isoform X3 [Limulus polyphemus]